MPYELSHDTIARQVYDKASTEARTRRKVERYVREHYQDWQERGAQLTQDDIDFIQPYLGAVNISAEEQAFIEEAKQRIRKAKLRLRLLVASVIAILAAISVVAIWQWRSAQEQTVVAQEQTELAVLAQNDALEQKNQAVAARLEADAKADSLVLKEAALQASLAEAEAARDIAEQERIKAQLARLRADEERLQAEILAMVSEARALPPDEAVDALALLVAAWERTPAPLPKVSQAFFDLITARITHSKMPVRPLPLLVLDGDGSFSPSGEYILTVKPDAAQLWDLKGNLLADFDQGADHISLATFSPKEDYVLTSSKRQDNTYSCKLWAPDGRLVTDFGDQGGWLFNVVFNPSGRSLLMELNNTYKLWTIDGEWLADLDHKNDSSTFRSAQFSPAGDYILTTYRDGKVTLWDRDGKWLLDFPLQEEDGGVSAEFHPSGEYVLTIPNIGIAKLWDLSGNQLAELSQFEHGAEYNGYEQPTAFSPTGDLLLLSDRKGNTELWSLEGELVAAYNPSPNSSSISTIFHPNVEYIFTVPHYDAVTLRYLEGNEVKKYSGHGFNLEATSWASREQLLVTSQNTATKLWSWDGTELANFDQYTTGQIKGAFFPDSEGEAYFLTNSEGKTMLWHRETELWQTFSYYPRIYKAAVLPAGDKLATISANEVVFWDLQGNYLNGFSVSEALSITDLQLSPSREQILLTAKETQADFYDQVAELWTLTGERLAVLDIGSNNDPNKRKISFSPSGEYILINYGEKGQLWNSRGERLASIERAKDTGVTSAVFSPTNDHILVSLSDGTVQLRDIAGNVLVDIGESYTLGNARFSPQGRFIFTTDLKNGKAMLWDLRGELLALFAIPSSDSYRRATISPTETHILTWGYEGPVKVWDMAGNLLREFSEDFTSIESVHFSPSGEYLLLQESYQIVRIFDLTGNLLATYEQPQESGAIASAEFTPDEDYIFMVTEVGEVRLCPTPWSIYNYLKYKTNLTGSPITQ